MSGDEPPVDLARGDRVGGFCVRSILGWGAEGVAADVRDEFLGVHRVLKAFPATSFWIKRIRYVTEVLLKLGALDVCPAPITGGVSSTNRGVPVVYLVVERRIGRPLEAMFKRPWSEARALGFMDNLVDAVARVHDIGWAMGDFEAGNNIVVIKGKPLFIDIGFGDEPFGRPSFEEDFECLADVARRLAQQSGSLGLIKAARSLADRSERRLNRRSLSVWKARLALGGPSCASRDHQLYHRGLKI